MEFAVDIKHLFVVRGKRKSRVAQDVRFKIGIIFDDVAYTHYQTEHAEVSVAKFVLQRVDAVGDDSCAIAFAEDICAGDVFVIIERAVEACVEYDHASVGFVFAEVTDVKIELIVVD